MPAAGQRGRVVVIERHVPQGGEQAEMNLRMLVFCGGRERDLDGYTALAAQAGLDVTGVHTTPMGQVSIECTPARHQTAPG